MRQVQPVLSKSGKPADAAEGPQLLVLSARTPAALEAMLPPGDHAHDLFVIDPLLNIVLRFDARENPKGLLEDIKKLLKLSHIG